MCLWVSVWMGVREFVHISNFFSLDFLFVFVFGILLALNLFPLFILGLWSFSSSQKVLSFGRFSSSEGIVSFYRARCDDILVTDTP